MLLLLHSTTCSVHCTKPNCPSHIISAWGFRCLYPDCLVCPAHYTALVLSEKQPPMCTSPNYCCLKSSHYVLHPTSHFIQKLPTCPPQWAHGAQTGGKLFWMRTRFGKLIWMRLTCRLLGGQAKFKRHMKNEIKIWSYIALDTFLSIG